MVFSQLAVRVRRTWFGAAPHAGSSDTDRCPGAAIASPADGHKERMTDHTPRSTTTPLAGVPSTHVWPLDLDRKSIHPESANNSLLRAVWNLTSSRISRHCIWLSPILNPKHRRKERGFPSLTDSGISGAE